MKYGLFYLLSAETDTRFSELIGQRTVIIVQYLLQFAVQVDMMKALVHISIPYIH